MPGFCASIDAAAPLWGSGYGRPAGGFVVPGGADFQHLFGGESWKIHNPCPAFGGPTLILTLDLRDPLLSELSMEPATELPLCTYTATDVWTSPQVYLIHPASREIELIERGPPGTEATFA